MPAKIPFLDLQFNSPFKQDLEAQLADKRATEKRAAEAQAFHAMAYREMPEDLRNRAKEWGVSALMEAVWLNAWENGYKQACRDAAALKDGA